MSITEVAKAANVSIATVSRVINGTGNVSSSTVERVETAMKQHGYNPPLRDSRRGPKREKSAQNNIGFLWTRSLAPAPVVASSDLVVGVSQALGLAGCHFLLDCPPDGATDSYLFSADCAGLLLHGPEPCEQMKRKILGFPCVWVYYSGSNAFGDRVQPDHRMVGRLGVEHFRKSGKQRFCCITSEPNYYQNTFWTERCNSFEQFSELLGTPCITLGKDMKCSYEPDVMRQNAMQLIAEYLALTPRPDALFVANNLGYFVHEELLRSGLPASERPLLIAGDANYQFASLREKPIVVDIHAAEVGACAVRQLLWRIKNPEPVPVSIRVSCSLNIPQ